MNALEKALTRSHFKNVEKIYVDAKSKDRSVEMARERDCHIYSITSGFTSPSMGRYLGLRAAKGEQLLFLDSDMELYPDWFEKSKEDINRHKTIIGERDEWIYLFGKVIKKIQGIKKIPAVMPVEKLGAAKVSGQIRSIGGFLMTHRSFFNEETFDPWIVDEEEADLYARNKDLHKIWAIPHRAYIHHNREYFYKKFIRVFMLYSNIGYLQSLLNAISQGYMVNYMSLQKKYLQSIVAGILLYSGLYLTSQLLLIFWLGLCFIDLGFYFTGVLRNSIILPYKLFGLVIFRIVPHRTSVKGNGKTLFFKYPGQIPS